MAMGTLADLEDQEPMTSRENTLSIHLKVCDYNCRHAVNIPLVLVRWVTFRLFLMVSFVIH